MNNGFNSPVRLSKKLWILIATTAILCNYYYLYFINFQQGEADAGIIFSSLKVIGTLLTCYSLLSTSIRTKYQPEAVFLLSFIFMALLIYTIKTAEIGSGDVMFLNGIMFLAPFLLLKSQPNIGAVRVFFECCTFIIAIQIILDTAILFTGHSIWENKAFIGGLGNPSSFGLICNILVCYILFKRKPSASSAFLYLLFAFGVYMTNSLLASLSLALITGLWLINRVSITRFFLGVVIFLIAILLGKNLASEHLEYKFRSVASMVNGSQDDQSASVSIRVQNNIEYADNFTKEPIGAFFYGFTQRPYMGYDSQLLTYASSFGILISLIFFLAITMLYFRTRRSPETHFASIIVLLFCITFLTNRIMDYYPTSIFLAVIFCLLQENTTGKRTTTADDAYSAPFG